MKTYPIIDWTGDSYLNPVPAIFDNGNHIRSISSITSIAVHHSAVVREHDYNDLDVAHAEAAEHYVRLGPGLQYHYKISNVGDIFHIRPLETWLYSVGSEENVSTLSIVLDGNFESQMPTREQFEALYQLILRLCTQHPEFPATWPDVRPHADFSSTACCGANLRNRIYAIQDQSSAEAQLLNVGDYDWPEYQSTAQPAPQPTPPVQPQPQPAPKPVVPTPPAPAPVKVPVTSPVETVPSSSPVVLPVQSAEPSSPSVNPSNDTTGAGWFAGFVAWLKSILGLK